MIDFLNNIDTELCIFLNGFHNEFWDTFMSIFTGKLTWIIMYATILVVLYKNYNWKTIITALILIALTITFADQMCNSVIRPLVGRLRPSHVDSPISDLIHIVNGKRGGGFGFPSCHASNSFALATLMILIFKNKSLNCFILLWAFINSYTRIYLGLHYPGDILAGALIGALGAYIIYQPLRFIDGYQHVRKTQYTYYIIVMGLAITTLIAAYSFYKISII